MTLDRDPIPPRARGRTWAQACGAPPELGACLRAALVLLLLTGAARSQDLDGGLRLGDRFEGVIATDADVDVVRFSGLSQERVTLAVRRLGGAAGGGLRPRLELRLLDVLGQPGALLASVAAAQGSTAIAGFELPTTGTYELRIRSVKGTSGAYSLRTRGRLSGALAKLGPPTSWQGPGQTAIHFDGRPGYALAGVLRSVQGDLALTDVTLHDPGGPFPLEAFATRKGRRVKLSPAPLLAPGPHVLSVASVGTAGSVTSSLRLRRAPGPRSTFRETTADALVPADGTLLLDELPALAVLSISDDGVVLEPGEGAPAVEVGQVLASASGGWLRSVLDVTPGEGGTLVVSTGPAALASAFDDLRLEFALGGFDALHPVSASVGLAGPTPPGDGPSALGAGVDLGGRVLYDGGGLRITVVEGRVAFLGGLSGSVDHGSGALLLDAELAAVGQLELELEADGALGIEDGSVPLSLPLVELSGPFGQPVVLALQVALALDVDFDGAGSVGVGVAFAQPLAGHWEQTAGAPGTWTDTSDAGRHHTWLVAPSSAGALLAHYQLDLSSALELDLAGLVDATLEAEPRLRGWVDAVYDAEHDVTLASSSSRLDFAASMGGLPALALEWLATAWECFGALVVHTALDCPFEAVGELSLERFVQGLGWTRVETQPLAGNASVVFAPVSEGTFRVRATVDADGLSVSPELSPELELCPHTHGDAPPPDPLDNLLAYDIGCECSTCTLPNLVVSDVTLTPSAVAAWEPGTPLAVSVSVANASPVAVGADYHVDLYLSRDDTSPIAIDHLLASLPGRALAPGGSFSAAFTFAVPSILACDDTFAWARVDPGQTVLETNEQDNLTRSDESLLFYDCDPVALVGFPEPSGTLGEGGGQYELAVSLTLAGGAITSDLTVAVSATGGDATEGADYTAFGTQQLVFPAGSTGGASQVLAVDVLDDLEDEPHETLVLGLSVVAGPGVAEAPGNTHTLTILDDDLPPPDAFVSFVSEASAADEDGGPHAVQLLLSVSEGSLITPVSVGLVDQGPGSATAGVDYTFGVDPIVFPAGSTDGTVMQAQVDVLDDTDPEDDETLTLAIDTIDGPAEPGDVLAHVVTIVDDDPLAQGGSFSQSTSWSTGGVRPIGLELGDWNGDGFLDLVIANFGSGTTTDSVVVVYNQNGSFISPTIVQIANTVDRPFEVLVGDLDGNGKGDVVGIGQPDPDMRIFLGSGVGFPNQFEQAGAASKWRAALDDLDDDGDPDFAVADGGAGVWVHLNDGTGTAFPGTAFDAGGSKVVDVEAASLDVLNDQLPDLVLVDQTAGTLITLLNQGGGVFTVANTLAVSANATAVSVGDLDDDGLPDYVVSNVITSELDVLFGDGLGGVLSSTTLPVSAAQDDVLLDDVNDDGFMDVCAVLKGTPGSVEVFWGDGTGGFPQQVNVVVENSPRAVRAGDVTGDGKKDLVVINLQSGSFNVLIQD